MKRDMELARTILQQMEEKSEGMGRVTLDLPNHASEEIHYHLKLLKQAGLIEATDCTTGQGLHFIPLRLNLARS